MIYLDYERYKLEEDQSYIELLQYCDELGFPIILKRNKQFMKAVTKIIGGKPAGKHLHLASKFFDYNATERSTGGSKMWRYSLHPILKDKEGYPTFEGDHGEFFDTLSLVFKRDDMERLWFLMTKSNMVTGRKIYSIYDPEKEYRERVEKESNEVGVKFFIMSKESPLTLSHLRTIAKSFGMSGVDDMSEFKMKGLLLDKVTELQKTKKDGFKRFMQSVNIDQYVAMKANVQDAIDKNIIGWMPRNLSWNWLDGSGQPIELICQVGSNNEGKKFDILTDFLISDENSSERLQRELGMENINEEEIDFVKLDKGKDDGGYSHKELLKFCKNVPNFNPTAKSRDVIIETLKKFYNAG
jgi:hypothetical protein